MALEKDIVVVGAGGAGLAAAIVAARQGLKVLVIEKTGVYGGATAWSGGNVWVPVNSFAAEFGIYDDRERAFKYLQQVLGVDFDADSVRAFLDAAPRMLNFFQDHTAVQFELQSKFADLYPLMDGASKGGRCVTPLPFDGKKLGHEFNYLRGPLEQVNAPFGMMIGFGDIEHLKGAGKSLKSFLHVLTMVGRHVKDKLLYKRSTRLTMGNALAARLLRSALDSGVEFWRETDAQQLLMEAGTVTGLYVKREGVTVKVKARRGVILASGGFSANKEMRDRWLPFAGHHVSHMPEGNTGDGINMALASGGQLSDHNRQNGDWVVSSVMKDRDGRQTKCLHTILDRPKPGCLAVNMAGQRFCNEADRNMVAAMHASNSVPAFLIGDQRFIKKYGMGLVNPGGIGLKKFIESGYLVKANSLAELAQAIHIDAEALEATVQRFNLFARHGADEDFGKGTSVQDRDNGDALHKPNPCLGELVEAPFYAVKILPGDASTWLGLSVDARCRVLSGDNTVIRGLYAVGLDANSLWCGVPPALGANNTLSLTRGYIAAMDMVAEA